MGCDLRPKPRVDPEESRDFLIVLPQQFRCKTPQRVAEGVGVSWLSQSLLVTDWASNTLVACCFQNNEEFLHHMGILGYNAQISGDIPSVEVGPNQTQLGSLATLRLLLR